MSRSASLAVFPEIVRVTLRQLLGRRRTLLLLLLAALPSAAGPDLPGRERDRHPVVHPQVSSTPVSMTIVLPLVAVLFGTGAFGAEIDDGTILYLLAKPVSRWIVVSAKAFAAAIAHRRDDRRVGLAGRSRRAAPCRGRRRVRHGSLRRGDGRRLDLLRVCLRGPQPLHPAGPDHRHRLHPGLGGRPLVPAARASRTCRSASTE